MMGRIERKEVPLEEFPTVCVLLSQTDVDFLGARFAYWHETDMATAFRNVRSQGQSGKYLLAASISPFETLNGHRQPSPAHVGFSGVIVSSSPCPLIALGASGPAAAGQFWLDPSIRRAVIEHNCVCRLNWRCWIVFFLGHGLRN